MTKFALTLATALMVAQPAFARIITLSAPSSNKIEGVIVKTKGTAATTAAEGKNLTVVGAFLRKKYKYLTTWKVYVGEFLLPATAAEGWKNVTDETALDYAAKQNVMAMNMHVIVSLRPVTAGDMKDAFKEGFAANRGKTWASTPALEQALNQFVAKVGATGNAKWGMDIQLVGEKLANGQEVVKYAVNDRAITQTGPQGFAKAVFSVWLGDIDSEDSYLSDAKQELVNYAKGN